MIKSALELQFGRISFTEKCLIAELNEGILFDIENNRQLLQIGKDYFKDKPYGYISNRNYSYAVNPMIYIESANSPNLKAIAVVTIDPMCVQNTKLEKQFYREKNPFEVFETLEEAIDWVNSKIG